MGVLLFAPLLENLYGRETRDAVRCSEVGLGGERGREGRKEEGKEDPWVSERGGEGPELRVEGSKSGSLNCTCIHLLLDFNSVSLERRTTHWTYLNSDAM